MGACVQCDAKLAGLTDREHRAEDLGVPDGVLRRLDAQHRRLIEVPPSPRRRWPAAREALHQRQCERPREEDRVTSERPERARGEGARRGRAERASGEGGRCCSIELDVFDACVSPVPRQRWLRGRACRPCRAYGARRGGRVRPWPLRRPARAEPLTGSRVRTRQGVRRSARTTSPAPAAETSRSRSLRA